MEKRKSALKGINRNLSILDKSRLILQAILNDNKEASLYRYSPAETCRTSIAGLGLNCGKTIIFNKNLEKLTEDAFCKYGMQVFSIDEASQTTIYYGRCKT